MTIFSNNKYNISNHYFVIYLNHKIHQYGVRTLLTQSLHGRIIERHID